MQPVPLDLQEHRDRLDHRERLEYNLWVLQVQMVILDLLALKEILEHKDLPVLGRLVV